MLKNMLILSVGGACSPLVNAIRREQPDFVYFICSRGPKGSESVVRGTGNPCEERRGEEKIAHPSIVAQTDLSEDSYCIVPLDDPDDFDECYRACETIRHDILKKAGHRGSLRIVANYTGGTKTMSAALVIFALGQDWELQCNRGPRCDLIKVRAGDIPMRVDTSRILRDQQFAILERFVKNFHYAEAADMLAAMGMQGALPTAVQRQIIRSENICRAFNAWDRFEHAEAKRLLEPHARYFPEHFLFLKRMLGQAKGSTGYEKIEDIIHNARRKAAQQRYDDAVARLYRAVEMMAQIRLMIAYEIETGDVDINKIPDAVREAYNHPDAEGKIRIGLRQAYQLLGGLEDPLGIAFEKQEKKVANALKTRNDSILAHGDTPIGKSGYEDVVSVVENFLIESLSLLGHSFDDGRQFPQSLQALLHEG